MWFLEASVKRAIERATAQGFTPSAEQMTEFNARTSGAMTTAGSVAQINVVGVLTQSPSFMAMLFGGGNTTYTDIISALAEADADPNIETISMFVDSPGGAVHGLFEAIAAIEATRKPIQVTASMACSAAYAVAAAAGPIEATSVGSMFGSIGIVVSGHIDEHAIELTSTHAPRKRNDPTTTEGRKAIVEELDALHTLFVEAIATGRGTTPDNVNATFGEGGIILANEAKNRGMIDQIVTQKQTATGETGATNEAKAMNEQELLAQHPGVYAAVLNKGKMEERDRVGAHLKMGEASGDMKTAIEAVNAGSDMTATLTATYLAAGMSRRDISAREEDDSAAAAAAAAAPAAAEEAADRDAKASMGILEAAAASAGVKLGD